MVLGAIGGFRSGCGNAGKIPMARVPHAGPSVWRTTAQLLPVAGASTLYPRALVPTLTLCEWDWTCQRQRSAPWTAHWFPHLSSLQSTGDFQQYLWKSCIVTIVGWGKLSTLQYPGNSSPQWAEVEGLVSETRRTWHAVGCACWPA